MVTRDTGNGQWINKPRFTGSCFSRGVNYTNLIRNLNFTNLDSKRNLKKSHKSQKNLMNPKKIP